MSTKLTKNGQYKQPELPFGGGGPVNLSQKQLQQAWGLQSILNYHRTVRELTDALRRETEARDGTGR